MPLIEPGKVYVLDTALADAIVKLIDDLDPLSPEYAFLAARVGRHEDLGEQLLDLLGLPKDNAWLAPQELQARLGVEKYKTAIAWFAE